MTVNVGGENEWVFDLFAAGKDRVGTPAHQQGRRAQEVGNWPCGSVVCPDNNRVEVKGEKCAACRRRIEKKFRKAESNLRKPDPPDNDRVSSTTPWVTLSDKERGSARTIERNARREKQLLEAGRTPEEVYGDRLT